MTDECCPLPGLVEMFSPSKKVPYKEPQVLNCTIDDTLSHCQWFIKKDSAETPAAIGNGTQIEVGSWCLNVTELSLKLPTGLWEGMFMLPGSPICHSMFNLLFSGGREIIMIGESHKHNRQAKGHRTK